MSRPLPFVLSNHPPRLGISYPFGIAPLSITEIYLCYFFSPLPAKCEFLLLSLLQVIPLIEELAEIPPGAKPYRERSTPIGFGLLSRALIPDWIQLTIIDLDATPPSSSLSRMYYV